MKLARRPDPDWEDVPGDVPAAILCARCGSPECAGCEHGEEESGVVSIVPWERPGPALRRLLATSELATHGAETFFAALPDGELRAPLAFATAAELFATSTMLATWGAALGIAAAVALPGLLALAGARLVGWALALPVVLTVWMVAAHVAHGLALGLGAERAGARPQRRRAVRFGLYSCGWDVASGPAGVIVALFRPKGPGVRGSLSQSFGVPGRAATAFLTGVFGLDEPAARKARRAGTVAAALATVLSALGVLACLTALALG